MSPTIKNALIGHPHIYGLTRYDKKGCGRSISVFTIIDNRIIDITGSIAISLKLKLNEYNQIRFKGMNDISDISRLIADNFQISVTPHGL